MTEVSRYRPYGLSQLEEMGVLKRMSPQTRFELRVVSSVLPFRVSRHVPDELLAKTDEQLHRYLERHRKVTDLLVTGGDPMMMKVAYFSRYLCPLCQPQFD